MRFLSKTMAIILFLSILLISLKNADVTAYATSNGSTIGTVIVDELSDKEIKRQLNAAIEDWESEEIYVTVGSKKIILSGDDFLFNIDKSIRKFKQHTEKPWYAFWQDSPTVDEPLDVRASASLMKKIKSETNLHNLEIKSQVLEAASYLKKSPINIKVNDFSMKDAERISFQSIALKDAQVLDATAIAKELDGVMIEPETPFSFNDIATKAGSNDDSMTLVASALYSAVLQSSFEIMERHQAEKIPTYIKPGYEATVSPFLEKDLKFISHSTVPTKIVASVKLNTLKIELFSLPGSPKVVVSEKDKKTVQSRKIYRYSKNLSKGESKKIQQAKPGLQLLIYRTITEGNGDSKTQLISQNYYAPQNEIIEKSSIQPTNNNDDTNEDSVGSNGQSVSEDLSNQDNSSGNLNSNSESSNSKEQNSISANHKEATKSKNGGSVPKGSYYNKSGDILTPKDTK
ncbi:VanW family protein [uncultured Rummeliibacillus sp.]|uniref:VanW family protein n=1 Tax=uncultured Rummeliibacillus sp. TaxID=762292 RepID=UPI00260C3075|nr:VanW family protein [uncultured Rummeliibacillus sp.]